MKKLLTTTAAIMLSLLMTCFPLQAVKAETPTISVNLTSDFAYVIDISNDQVLYDLNGHKKMYPASLTKMMTAILALENLHDLDQKVTITYQMLAGLWQQGASMAGFGQGEDISVRDLLYGVAMPSGADAANALAITVSGSLEGFAAAMNEKARQLGMNDTHFVNATGLHDDDHYSTAYDMATLLAYCLENQDFQEIFSRLTYTTAPTRYYPDGIEFWNNSKYYIQHYGLNAPGFTGCKSGYTEEAGHCLASWAQHNGMTIITIVAHADTAYRDRAHLYDTAAILAQLSDWQPTAIMTEGQLLGRITVEHAFSSEVLDVRYQDTVTVDMPDTMQLIRLIELKDSVQSASKPRTIKGTLTVSCSSGILYEKEITVTIPRERNLLARIVKAIGEFFHKG